ncbi:MAG: CBS domain-containing protein, partial [Limisphaerales bacterium]
GILSERDYTRKVVLQGRSSKITTVQEIMTRDVICVTPQHGVEQVLRLITENRVRHLPVIERGRVTGLISIGDLVKWVIHAQRSALSQLEAYVAGGYPG